MDRDKKRERNDCWSEEAKHKLLTFLYDAGVDIFLQTPVVDTVKEGNKLKGVVVSTQFGLKTLHTKVVIDATGGGFVAASSGAKCAIGRDSDGKCQPTTLEFIVENCRLKSTPSTLGVRETRRVIGDYVLNDTDVETGTQKADVVVHKAWFVIDIHNPVGGGQAEGYARQAIPYDIPYGCLLPQGLENILTCGRCISGTHRAHASYRVMGICLATGQAAGVAAALSALSDITPRALPVDQLQAALQRSGAQLFD